MSKSRLIKRLAKEITIATMVLTVAGGLTAWCVSLADEAEENARNENTALLQAINENTMLKNKLAQLKDALPLYKKLYTEDGESRLSLNRDMASAVFERLREKHVIQDLRVIIAPIQPSEDPAAKKPSVQVIQSPITFSMAAFSDVQVAQFMDELAAALPGQLRFNRIMVTNSRPASLLPSPPDDTPSQDKNEPNVRVEAELVWYGMEVLTDEKDAAGATP